MPDTGFVAPSSDLENEDNGFVAPQSDVDSLKKKGSTISGSFLEALSGPKSLEGKSPLASSISGLEQSKSESTKIEEPKISATPVTDIGSVKVTTTGQSKKNTDTAVASPGSTPYAIPAISKKDLLKEDIQNKTNQFNSQYSEFNSKYNNLDKEIGGYINVLNNPIAPIEAKQNAQAILEEKAPEIQALESQKKDYDVAYNNYVSDIHDLSEQVKQVALPTSYSEGSSKAYAMGTADIFDDLQGVNDFLSKYLFGYDRGIDAGGGFSSAANAIRENADRNLGDMPETFQGKVLEGVAGSVPLILSTMLAPETAIPKFATTMGALAFGGEYKNSADVLKSIESGGYGLTEGAILHGLGVAGESIGKWASGTNAAELVGKELTGVSAAALVNSVGFGAYDAAQQFLNTGTVDVDKVYTSLGTGLAFSLPGLAKAMFERAVTKTVSATPDIIEQAEMVDKTPAELRDDAAKVLSTAVGGTAQEKAQAYILAKSFTNIADLKSGIKIIKLDPAGNILDINKSDMPEEQKKQAIANVNNIIQMSESPEIKNLKAQKVDLMDKLDAAQLIEIPEERDIRMNDIALEIKDVDGELKSLYEKKINSESINQLKPIQNEKESSKKGGEEESRSGHSEEDSQTRLSEPEVKEGVLTPKAEGESTPSANLEYDKKKAKAESYIDNLPESELAKIEADLNAIEGRERVEYIEELLNKKAGVSMDKEQIDRLIGEPNSFVHDVADINEPLRPKENAIQEQSASGVLPSAQEGVGETWSERSGVGQVKQGTEAAKEGEEEKVKNIQSLSDEDYVKAFVDSGQLAGRGLSMRMDLSGVVEPRNLDKAIESLKGGGKPTADAVRLKDAILKTKYTGKIPMIEGVGGITERGTEDVQRFQEDIINAAPEEKKPTEEIAHHDGVDYIIKRNESGAIESITDNKGAEVTDNKLFNTVSKIAEVAKTGSAALSKDVGASEMKKLGVVLEKIEPEKWSGVLEKANEKVESGEVDPAILLNMVEAKPRTLSPVEIAILARHKIDINKSYDKVLEKIKNSPAGEDISYLLAEQSEIENRLINFERVFHDVIRPSAGRSLAALGMIMKKDYSLLNIMTRAKAAEVGKDVPEKIKEILTKRSAEIEELTKNNEELTKKMADLYSENKALFKKADLNKALRRAKILSEAEVRKSGRIESKEAIDKAIEKSFEKLQKLARDQRSTLGSLPINAEMIVEMGKIAANYIKKGIVDIAQIVDSIYVKMDGAYSKDDIENAIADSIVSQSMKEARELPIDLASEGSVEELYSKFKLGADRTIDDIKKTEKNKNTANKKISEIEKATDVMKKYWENAKVAEAKRKKAEQVVDRVIKERKDKSKTRLQKTILFLPKVYKALILSGIKTPIKLGAAVANIVLLKPGYVGIGKLLSMVPGISKIYNKAPAQRQGAGALLKFATTVVAKETIKESGRELMGKGTFGSKSEGKKYDDSGVLNVPGRSHSAIKVFGKLPEYEASLYELRKDFIDRGEDPFEPANAAAIDAIAVGNALNGIMMDDNKIAGLWNNVVLSTEKSEHDGIKALGALLSIEDPIVKVPLNTAAAVWEHIPVIGLLMRLGEIKKGTSTEGGLTLQEANDVARNITRQGMGLVVAGVATWAYQNYGDEAEEFLKEHKLFLHNGVWQAAELFGTIAKEANDGKGFVAGTGKAGVKFLQEDVPFVRSAEEMARTMRKVESGQLLKAGGEFVGKLLSNTDSRNLAKYIDEERKTNPQGFWEAVANDIPGLRQFVSSDRDVAFAKKWNDQQHNEDHFWKEVVGLSDKEIEDMPDDQKDEQIELHPKEAKEAKLKTSVEKDSIQAKRDSTEIDFSKWKEEKGLE